MSAARKIHDSNHGYKLIDGFVLTIKYIKGINPET